MLTVICGDFANIEKDSILRFCHNLVIWDSAQKVLRFAHLSVREFLENSTLMAGSNTIVAEACLAVLCSPNKQTGKKSTIDLY